jgi:hypothetical protein
MFARLLVLLAVIYWTQVVLADGPMCGGSGGRSGGGPSCGPSGGGGGRSGGGPSCRPSGGGGRSGGGPSCRPSGGGGGRSGDGPSCGPSGGRGGRSDPSRQSCPPVGGRGGDRGGRSEPARSEPFCSTLGSNGGGGGCNPSRESCPAFSSTLSAQPKQPNSNCAIFPNRQEAACVSAASAVDKKMLETLSTCGAAGLDVFGCIGKEGLGCLGGLLTKDPSKCKDIARLDPAGCASVPNSVKECKHAVEAADKAISDYFKACDPLTQASDGPAFTLPRCSNAEQWIRENSK